MSLALTSDDSLALILSFLAGQDVMRLIATGSTRLIRRVTRTTTNLFWTFSRPVRFPACSFDFINLKALTIKKGRLNGHVSLQDRSILPLEPMASLESLHLDFPTSIRIFEPATSRGGITLASQFPKLTSLSVHSAVSFLPPADWAESLPRGLLSLTLDIVTLKDNQRSDIAPSSLEHLPLRLKHLEFKPECFIGSGKVNLKQFTDLRALRIGSVLSWDVLESLPDFLEELELHLRNPNAPHATFALSKLPPKIRALTLHGSRLKLNFDSMAPSSLEELSLDLDDAMELQETTKFFHTKNLRMAGGVDCRTPEALAVLPNLKEIPSIRTFDSEVDTLEILPRKLQSLYIPDCMRTSPSVSFKHLPPTLTELYCHVLSAEDVLELPKTIKTLAVDHSDTNPSLTIPTAVWRELPSEITRLGVPLRLLDPEACFHVLPEGLEDLALAVIPPDGIIERITFPKSLKKSLKRFVIHTQDTGVSSPPPPHVKISADSLLSKLSEFSRLVGIRIATKIVVKSSSLSSLPKTLVELALESVEFENFGLPEGQSPQNSDWKEGALSRLPEGLEELTVKYSTSTPGSIDYDILSRLPRGLTSLIVFSDGDVCRDLKRLFSTLPRRLAYLSYKFTDFGGTLSGVSKELQELTQEYYSDPFWNGHRTD